jgi:hypothetical protein
MERCLERIPLLKGEGGPKGRVRGERILLFTPHPPLRGTLSLQERDSLQTFFHSDRISFAAHAYGFC